MVEQIILLQQQTKQIKINIMPPRGTNKRDTFHYKTLNT